MKKLEEKGQRQPDPVDKWTQEIRKYPTCLLQLPAVNLFFQKEYLIDVYKDLMLPLLSMDKPGPERARSLALSVIVI